MDISDKKKKALKNIAWAICGKIFSLLSVLVVGIIVARYLGKEQYGVMNYVPFFRFLQISVSISSKSEKSLRIHT